ncbi:MAG TPA: RNB domain-containing ribonuclease [Pyrinomonadaceae bacterium]|jgi:exoribonuclease-2
MNQLTTTELETLFQKALTANDFRTELSAEVVNEAKEADETRIFSTLAPAVRDLRTLLWSSIDNRTSRDLDQVEYAELLPNGDIRLRVAIADVDAFAPKNSAIDAFAAQNTTSIYAGETVFPMLPAELSNNLTSLLENFDRLAVVTEMIVCEDGNIESTDVYRAVVHNYAKLSYEEIGAWLEDKAELPEAAAKVENLQEQLRLQQKAAMRLQHLRTQKGALEFETIEAAPVISGGVITGIEVVRSNAARKIIENFMIAANVEMAEFLERSGVTSLRRVVKTPERWNRIVEIAASFGENLPDTPDSKALADFLARQKAKDSIHYPDLSLSVIKLIGSGDYTVQIPNEAADGHFGLAVHDYTHSTAPNRRYSDLIVQRLVKATLENKPSPYSLEELEAIAEHCNERESAARKVERQMRKTIAASVMATHIGEEFEAIVTGKTHGGTFARIIEPPVDGRIVEGEERLQVGEKVRVRLLATNAENGFIDFADAA